MRSYRPLIASKLFIAAVYYIVLFISCKKSSDTATHDNEIATVPPKVLPLKTKISELSLTVAFHTIDEYGNTCKITGDGKGDYENGKENVLAIIDENGNFKFGTQASTRPHAPAVTRSVKYVFDDPLNGYNAAPTIEGIGYWSAFVSIKSNLLNTFIPLQELGTGGRAAFQCITLGIGWSPIGVNDDPRVSFHRGYEDVITSPTAYAVVTRLSPTQWKIAPIGSCSVNSMVGAFRSGDGSVLYGYYYLPFEFILTVQS